jgi:hypothetical protein
MNRFRSWLEIHLEAGKKRLMGDTTREANSLEVNDLKKEKPCFEEKTKPQNQGRLT